MPIDPSTTLPVFTASLISNGLVGVSNQQLAAGLSMGLFQYAHAGVIVTSIDAGTVGNGTGIGPSIILPEPLILSSLTASFAGHGIIGPFMPMQANAIASGISTSLALSIVQTLNPLVGMGTGKLQLIPTGAGSAIFPAALIQSGIAGPMATNMGAAVGLGLDAVIAAAIGIIAIVGSPNIVPSTGLGTGIII